jgi:hypothetical protein
MSQVGATGTEEEEEEDSRDMHTGCNLPNINLKFCIVLSYFSLNFQEVVKRNVKMSNHYYAGKF